MKTLYEICLSVIVDNKISFNDKKLSKDIIDDLSFIVSLFHMQPDELLDAVKNKPRLAHLVMDHPELIRKINHVAFNNYEIEEQANWVTTFFRPENRITQEQRNVHHHNLKFNYYLYNFLNDPFVYKLSLTHKNKHLLKGLENHQKEYLKKKYSSKQDKETLTLNMTNQ